MKLRAETHCNSLDREAWVQVHIFLFSKTEAAWSLKLCFIHNITETQQCGSIKVLTSENQMCSHFVFPIIFFSPVSQRNPFSGFLTFHLFRKSLYHYFNRPQSIKYLYQKRKKKSGSSSKGKTFSEQEKW